MFFFFFWFGLRDPIACSLLGGGIPSHKNGYKVNRLCPYIMLVFYSVSPPSIPDRRHSMFIPSSSPVNSSLFESAATSAALFFAPSKSILACSHHRRDTLAPASNRTSHRRPESVASEYSARPCSASLLCIL